MARGLVLAEQSNSSTTLSYLLCQCSAHQDGKVSPTMIAGKSQQYFTEIHDMLTEVHKHLPCLKGLICWELNGSDMLITRLSKAVLVYGSYLVADCRREAITAHL